MLLLLTLLADISLLAEAAQEAGSVALQLAQLRADISQLERGELEDKCPGAEKCIGEKFAAWGLKVFPYDCKITDVGADGQNWGGTVEEAKQKGATMVLDVRGTDETSGDGPTEGMDVMKAPLCGGTAKAGGTWNYKEMTVEEAKACALGEKTMDVLKEEIGDATVLVACAGGVRSVFAVYKLIQAGIPCSQILHANKGVGCG